VCEFEAAVRLGRAVPRGKIEAISRLNGYAADVKAVAGKLLRLRGGLVSRAKGLYNARQWETELHDLAKNIDSAVGDLTFAEVTQQGAEVRQQGAAAKHAQQGAAEFYTKILAQQEGLSRQVALLQRAGEAGSGSTALEEVVRELAEELRMDRSDVAMQLEEERFLLHQNMAQLSDLEGRVLQALDTKALSGADVARLGAVVGEHLAALDAHFGANADAVAAAVAASLKREGVSAAGVQAAVREELEVTAHLRCACVLPMVARMVQC